MLAKPCDASAGAALGMPGPPPVEHAPAKSANKSGPAINARVRHNFRLLVPDISPSLVATPTDAFVISSEPWPSQGGVGRVVKTGFANSFVKILHA